MKSWVIVILGILVLATAGILWSDNLGIDLLSERYDLALAPGGFTQCTVDDIDADWLEAYKRYLKDNENDRREGRNDDGLWDPIDSPEGGHEICYGHKLHGDTPWKIRTGGKTFTIPPDKLTDADCDQLLEEDIYKHWRRARECVESRHRGVLWCDLSVQTQIMFTDYDYTGTGCAKFPKFHKAVLEGNWVAACAEYKRYFTDLNDGLKKPIQKRNDDFCKNFLEPHGCNCGGNGKDFDFPDGDGDTGSGAGGGGFSR